MEELKALLEAQAKAFDDFKKLNDQEIATIKKGGSADVLLKEHSDRVNTEITTLTKAIDELKVKMSRTPNPSDDPPSADPEYKKSFETWFRKGGAEPAQKAMQTGNDVEGGLLVPTEYEKTIQRFIGTVSAMRDISTVRPIGTNMFKKPIQTSGVASGWVGETGARSESTAPNLAELSFPVFEVYSMPMATQQLLDDSYVNIEDWLASEVSISFAEKEGPAFISGSGVTQPKGFLSYTMVANASWAQNKVGFVVTGSAADFDYTVSATANPADELMDLQTALKPIYRPGAAWLMNRTVEAKVRKFKDADGNYIWQPSIQVDKPATLLGHRLVIDDSMPDVGANTFPVAFGDFKRGYLILDRVGIRVLRDPFSNKPYVAFYSTKRVGGGIQEFDAIKVLKCST